MQDSVKCFPQIQVDDVSSNNAVEYLIPHKTSFPKAGFREFNLQQVIGVLTLKI